jgi:NYN domain
LGLTLPHLPRTIVYVDGFNFYYAAFRGKRARAARLKWLDITQFSRLLLPDHDVGLVRYFTAAVKPVQWDPSQHLRQGAYLRALASLPEVSVHKGSFARWKVRRPLVDAPPEGPATALVWDTKEKGSDVNLATYLLLDAFERSYETAIVISDDSDLLEPVRVVRERLDRRVGVVRVRTDRGSVFRGKVDLLIEARAWHFEQAQLPEEVKLSTGGIVSRPAAWH